jgi:hypothetical protein
MNFALTQTKFKAVSATLSVRGLFIHFQKDKALQGKFKEAICVMSLLEYKVGICCDITVILAFYFAVLSIKYTTIL